MSHGMSKPGEDFTDNPLTALEGWFRGLVREEIQQALKNQNGHREVATLISAKEAAKRWDVPKTWIESMARRGELPCVQLGIYKRFNPTDLEQFIRAHRK